MLHIHFSNRLETLRTLLLQQLDLRRAGVFEQEQVIVPHAAMRRALSLAIADARGICANVEFAFLAQWLWQQIARLVPGVADNSPFAASGLAWRVHAAFGDATFVAQHARLGAYLRDADAVMRHDLAGCVAALLELYVTYRPDWLRAWREGQRAGFDADAAQDEAWQAALWQRIDADLGMHALHPAQAFVEALQRGGQSLAQRAGLPASVHVFALPGMPSLHLQLLQALALMAEVHVYALNPCREYWFELVDRRRLSHLAAQGRDMAHEEGNRLLASWGKATQSQLEALVDLCGDAAEDSAHFEPAPGDSLLQRVQDAVLTLQPIEPASIPLAEGDRSIELHVCHSLTRELEVLHDHLLGLFKADAGLRPGDILVVTPELDRAVPLIDAIFGTVPRERHIPYAIAGRSRSGQNPCARALLALLALAASRCQASALFALLQQPVVARRFALDDDALAQIHAWLREAGFRWALDARHLAGIGLPATPRHTLDDALQRLFLGHALPAVATEPFDGRLGAGNAEGSRALALGALWHFAGALQRLHLALRRPRLPEDWATLLFGVLDDFLQPDETELDDHREVQSTIRQLIEDMHAGGIVEPLPQDVVRAALQQLLDDPARSGTAGGAVSFASMSSHRGLPFEVVCILGLNDGSFPSATPALEFDLLALHPRRGDRQRRHDERALMLDLLLAARRSLYLSHTGRSVRDNAPLPPSVLVAELLDVLLPAIAPEAADAASPQAQRAARERLVVEHSLQPFGRPCFTHGGDPRLRSFNHELAEALRHSLVAKATLRLDADGDALGPDAAAGAEVEAAARRHGAASFDDADAGEATLAPPTLAPPVTFFNAALPTPEDAWQQVSLEQLVTFYRQPARYLLRRRLRIDLPRESEELEDDEVFVPDRRASAALARRLLPPLLAGVDVAAVEALALAGSEMPDGAIGQRQLQRELSALQRFAEQVRSATAEPCLPPQSATIEISLDSERWSLQADFAELRSGGLLRWRYGNSRADDYLEAWLRHLALCAAAPAGVMQQTRWLSADGEFALRACIDAQPQLETLLRLYRRGLREPLHFYPQSAWQFVLHAPEGRSAAQGAWRATPDRPYGEQADPAYRLALRGLGEPLDAQFEDLAQQIFGPLCAHLHDARLGFVDT